MKTYIIFLIISCLVLTFITIKMPKNMKRYEIYATGIFAVMFGLIIDTILTVKYKLYVLAGVGVQIPALLGQVILYSTASTIVLNYYPYEQPVKYKIIYVLFASLVTLLFEYVAYQFEFITYFTWNMWYSAVSYPFLILFIVFHYKFFRWLLKQNN